MSHFTVLVVGDDYEGQLAPFQENNMGDCPEEYLEFEDETDELWEKYETGGREKILKPDGTSVGKHNAELKDAREKEGKGRDDYNVMPEGYELVITPYKELFSTFEEFVKDYNGNDAPHHISEDPEHIAAGRTARYGYDHNPNSKWDWYQVGGRWAGAFKIKPEFLHLYPLPDFSWGWNAVEKEKVIEGGYRDKACKDHIDFEAMQKKQDEENGERYDRLALYNKLIKMTVKDLMDFVSEHPDRDTKEPFKKLWDIQPEKGSIVVKKDALHSIITRELLGIWNYHDNLLMAKKINKMSRDEFILNHRGILFPSYAMLKDGEWYERGQMGWFGCASNEMSEDDWDKKLIELIETIPGDTLLTMVDCHI